MRAALLCCLLGMLVGAVSVAAETPVTPPSATPNTAPEWVDEQVVISQVLAQSPTLRAAFLDLRAARAAQRAADATYLPIFTAALTGNHNEQPTLTLQGTTITNSDSVEAKVGVGHQLPIGTRMSLDVRGNASRRRLNPTPATNMFITLGPAYATEIRATVTQPLLRGAGVDVGEAPQRSARLLEEATRHGRDRAASEALRDALKAYWELAYATAALQVQQQSLEVSQRQYREATQRAELGLLAQADVLHLASDVAQLKEGVAAAQANCKTLAIQLGLLLGKPPENSAKMRASETPTAFALDERTQSDWIERAVQQSSELKELAANTAVAQNQVRSLDDASEARLDLSAWASLQGLGDKDAVAPLGQLARAAATSVFVSLELELPFDNSQRASQLQEALLQADASEARLEQQRLALSAAIESQIQALQVSKERIALAQETAAVAQALAEAEQNRYQLGTTTITSVIIAQQAMRDANLRLLRARADQNRAAVELTHLTGDLLARYSSRNYGVLQ